MATAFRRSRYVSVMFQSSHIIGVMLALGAAAMWGTGDFTGGVATRRASQYQVLVMSAMSGLVFLLIVVLASGEPFPGRDSLLWAIGAGALGGMGLAALYKGLAEGSVAAVAPTAAVVGASLPVVFGSLFEGLLEPQQIAGVLVALGGIWLVSREPDGGNGMGRKSVLIGALAGCGFAGFLVMISLVDPESTMTSLSAARFSTLVVALLMCYRAGQPIPKFGMSKLAVFAGVADVTGNMLFVQAQQYTRLDVAAVLASLYPAATVLLAWTLLRQLISGRQWIGLVCCLGGVMLIAG